MDIVNWQSVLTEHQVHLLREFAQLPGVRLRVVTSRHQLKTRQAQGWVPPDLSGLDVTTLPLRPWLVEGLRMLRQNRTAHHLFGGLWADRRLFALLVYARIAGYRISVMTEPYADVAVGLLREQSKALSKIKPWLRRIAYRMAGMLFGSVVSPLFAISPKAVAQFTQAGFRHQAICPFGYFVPPSVTAASPVRSGSGKLRLAFVGGALHRKGLDIACEAVRAATADGVDVCLHVYGPEVHPYMPATSSSIRNCGVIAFGNVQKVLASYDALVVPSRFDGWAVVVNEALLQSVPVIASDAVGAAAMIQKNGVGFVFPSDHSLALAEVIKKLANVPEILAAARNRILTFQRTLLPSVAARYMLDCFEANTKGAPRPICPWY